MNIRACLVGAALCLPLAAPALADDDGGVRNACINVAWSLPALALQMPLCQKYFPAGQLPQRAAPSVDPLMRLRDPAADCEATRKANPHLYRTLPWCKSQPQKEGR